MKKNSEVAPCGRLKIMNDIEAIIKPHFKDSEEYVPIEPVDVLGELVKKPAEDIIKLDGNENPYGCSP
ncbi:MAG: hypothetical protein Q8P44_07795, partial [Dehalococcoidia bacterium]|nr:hypothetical protein [Dehalococcoidia bacterium]